MELEGLYGKIFGLDSSPYEEHRRLGRYKPVLKTLKPIRRTGKHSAPIDNSGLLSFITISWLSDAIYKARKSLTFEDLPALSKYESVGFTAPRFYRIYMEEREKKGHNAVIGKTLFRFVRSRFWFGFFLSSCYFIVALVGPPVVVNRLVLYTSAVDRSIGYGIGLCFALLVANLARALLYTSSFSIVTRTLLRVRSGLARLIYWKLIRLKSFNQKSAGEMINLLVNDLQRISDMLLFSCFMCGAPVGILVGTVYAGFILGWTAIIGLVAYLSLVPLQAVLVKFGVLFRRKSIDLTDRRVGIMGEVLSSIKMIKLYAWESSFAEEVGKIRKSEIRWLNKIGGFQTLLFGIIPSAPIYVTVVTLLVHIGIGNPLTAAQAFTAMVIFTSMRTSVGLLPLALKAFTESLVAITRYNELMCMEEIEEYVVQITDKYNAIELKSLTASSIGVQEEDRKSSKKQTNVNSEKQLNGMLENQTSGKDENVNLEEVELIHDITLDVRKGSVTGICGAVGSGKSSLISAILGHLRIKSGSVGIDGKLAYVPQQAWIFHASLRDNVLFGKPYEAEKYQRVIEACALQPDIDILPDGDLTEIGERGITLSGGQKQRVSLARALYSDCDVILLDDPLSAVDAHVGKHIFWNCIKQEMKGKTVLFVTHQLQYLKDCDDVIMLKEGRIAEHGTHDQLMADGFGYAELIRLFQTDKNEKEDKGSDDNKSPVKEEAITYKGNKGENEVNAKVVKEPQSSLMVKENREFGSVSWKTYKVFMKAMGGYTLAILLYLNVFLHIFATNATTYWITYWINQGGMVLPSLETTHIESIMNYAARNQAMLICPNGTTPTPNNTVNCTKDPNISTNPRRGFFMLVYGCILLASGFVLVFRTFTYPRAMLRAASVMHKRLFATVLRCPMTFFDRTPIGQLLNRFSQDMDEMDNRLVATLNSVMQIFSLAIISLATICLVFPIFLVACVILVILVFILFNAYRNGIREFKRFANVYRSPLISHIAATIYGLPSIHAYRKEDDFLNTFSNLMDTHSVPFSAYVNSVHWVVVRLDSFSIAVNFTVAVMVVVAASYPQIFGVSDGTASAGLALTYAVQFTGLLTVLSRITIEAETQFTSVERVREYSELDNLEAERVVEDNRPPDNWPENGSVRFHEVSMRYREELPEVLKKVSFEIKPQEKVGIVGRTGSGKSSLGVALFRLVEISGGSIHIDDLDAGKIGLDDLRKKLTIIPQDPVLFVGTVRHNLDPFQQYSDKEIWQALERSHVKKLIENLPNKLESEVVENGENFSVGERQLMCMARAILRHSRIIMLDEATAAIDSETDSLVQDTIREAFKDCTMLTIAHRLNTVLTCDKILVMDGGKVAEFDEPANLLSNPDSQFSKMIVAAGMENGRGGVNEVTSPERNKE